VAKLAQPFIIKLMLHKAAGPELGILPESGAQIKNQKEQEFKLKIRRSRSSVPIRTGDGAMAI